MAKRLFYSLFASLCSIIGIIGIIFSNAISEILIFVIATISGLFTLAVYNQNN